MGSLRRKVGGYIDRQAVNRARRANERARQIVRAIIDEKPGNGRLYVLLADLALCLSVELEALTEMEAIRDSE